MRVLAVLLMTASLGYAEDPKPIELAGMKATPPKEWKQQELPEGSMRKATFVIPKADGDKEDADLAVFYFKTPAGSLEANLKRQVAKFLPAEDKKEVEEKVSDVKVGTMKAKYQVVSGTYKKKPMPTSDKFTPMKDYQQIYVVLETTDGTYYLNLLGPAKTVEKNKKSFDEFLASFK